LQTKPAKAEALMRTLRDDRQNLVFDASERLTARQIQGWFSQNSRKRKKDMAVANALAKV